MLETASIASYGESEIPKRAEFRARKDGDDENSRNLFKHSIFDEILVENPPLSYPHMRGVSFWPFFGLKD